MRLKANTPTRLLKSCITRDISYITLLTDASVYILKHRPSDVEDFLDNGFPLKQYGVHEVRFYTGELYVVTDTNGTDIRVIDY